MEVVVPNETAVVAFCRIVIAKEARMKKCCMLLIVLVLATIALSVVCFAEEAKYTFYGVGVDPSVDPFFAMVLKGFEAAEAIFPVDVVYVGLSAEEINPTGLVNKLEIARASGADGLITGFWMAEAEDEVVRAMIAEGIAVMAINQNDVRAEGDRVPYLGYVGQDESQTGMALAQATLGRMSIGRAVIAIHAAGSASLETRASGIASVLEANGIPFDKLDITTDPSTAVTNLGAYITQHPETNVIFALGASGTHSALSLLMEQDLIGKVVISTFDITEPTVAGIRDGRILLTVSQQPFMQSFMAVQLLYTYLEYGIVPPEHIPTGPTMVDIDNIGAIEKQVETTGGA